MRKLLAVALFVTMAAPAPGQDVTRPEDAKTPEAPKEEIAPPAETAEVGAPPVEGAANTEITEAEFLAAAGKPGFNPRCLHLTDSARGIMHALTANQYGHSTAGTGFSIEVCTPANWIARKIGEAKREYRAITWADLDEQDRVNLLHVLALPDRTTNLNVENGDSVAHVVLRHPDKKRRQTVVVQPVFKRPFGTEQQNNLGGKAALAGIDAAFAFDSLATVRDEKGEFLVTVVGEGEEKNFRIKTKHLDDLGIK